MIKNQTTLEISSVPSVTTLQISGFLAVATLQLFSTPSVVPSTSSLDHITTQLTSGSLQLGPASATNTLSSSSSNPSTSSTAPIPSPSNPASHKSSPSIGPIVGGVIGGMSVLAILLALVVLLRQRQSRNRAHPFDPAESEAQTSDSILRTASPMSSQANGRASLLIEPERRTKAARRQEYLQDQVQQIQQEVHDLQSSADTASVASSSSPRLGGVEADMRRMVEQIEIMKAQIERLQGQVQSEWAQGLSDEPPPGYETAGDRAGTIANL